MLDFKDVEIRYNNFIVLADFNCKIEKGEIVTLFGPSGCGKSTLMKAVLGMIEPYSGSVTINGTKASAYNEIISYTPQDNQLLPWLSVARNIELWAKESGNNTLAVEEILNLIDLERHRNKIVKELSGGMARRCALARGMVTKSGLMCLDEVLVSVERGMRRKLMINLRRYLKENNITTMIISHDYEEAVFMSDRIIILSPPPTELLRGIDVINHLGEDRNEEMFEGHIFKELTSRIVT